MRLRLDFALTLAPLGLPRAAQALDARQQGAEPTTAFYKQRIRPATQP